MKCVLALIFLLSFNSYAQYSNQYSTYKNKYPNAHSVRLNKLTTIVVKLNKKGIDITQEFLEEDLYLDESATNYGSKRALSFSSFFELVDVEASSYSFEKGKYRESKVEEFIEKDELDQSFYDDTKSLNFIYPDLKKGSKSKLLYTEKVKVPRFLSPFYFGGFRPIINNKVSIIADKNITFRFQEFNTENIDIKFSKEERKGNVIYTWEAKQIDEFKYEEDVSSYKNILPHIVPIITSYKLNGVTENLASNVSDLYKWYYSLVKEVNSSETDENLVALVHELTKDKTNDLDKVKAIYYWTQKNIKYIAFEYALGGFVPREANDVFKKKYGDCKDNSSILSEMLEIAGLKGHLTWIGTRSIPYSYNEVPTPLVDNHMILSYKYEDKTYFLDATGRFTPIDFPTSFIQGKEALISNGDGDFVVQKVPVISAKQNALIDVTTIDLDGDDIIGKTKVETSGYRKIDLFNYLENKTNDEKIKSYYNSKFQKGNNKFLIESYTEINKYDYDKNFILEFNFNINDYAKKLGDEIYINLNFNKELSNYRTEEDREYDIEYRYKNHYNYTTILNIPEGYKVDYIPENVELSNEYVSSKTAYIVDDNQIIYKHTITLNFLILDKQQQKEVNALIKKTEKGYKEIIVLKQN